MFIADGHIELLQELLLSLVFGDISFIHCGYWSVCVVELDCLPQGSGIGTATTIQFHAISLNGLGKFAHNMYGPRHIAIPTCIVRVGAMYSLNCDVGAHGKIHHAHAGIGGRIGIIQLVGNANNGSHLSKGVNGKL